jgi:hypothetical protein
MLVLAPRSARGTVVIIRCPLLCCLRNDRRRSTSAARTEPLGVCVAAFVQLPAPRVHEMTRLPNGARFASFVCVRPSPSIKANSGPGRQSERRAEVSVVEQLTGVAAHGWSGIGLRRGFNMKLTAQVESPRPRAERRYVPRPYCFILRQSVTVLILRASAAWRRLPRNFSRARSIMTRSCS